MYRGIDRLRNTAFQQFSSSKIYNLSQLTYIYVYVIYFKVMFYLLCCFPDVAHHDVDKGVLDEAEEHEEGAGGHEHVYRLQNIHILQDKYFNY